MSYVGRFAPSPTGPLHFGSLVAAVGSWLDARAAGGLWYLRIEDVDAPRTVPGAADSILRTLEDFGLTWDGAVVWQSRRSDAHAAALERLRENGLVYGCKCSRREIADSAASGIEGAIYPGTCRDHPPGPHEACALRLRAPDATIAFDDRVQGPIAQNVAREIGDFIVRRRDGLYAYQLAVVVDDAEQAVTDVVRGADLLASTPRQIVLQRALGVATPRYLHLPVAVDARGRKLSKQNLALPVEAGAAVPVLGAALRFLGQEPVEAGSPRELLEGAVACWQPARIARATERAATDAALPLA